MFLTRSMSLALLRHSFLVTVIMMTWNVSTGENTEQPHNNNSNDSTLHSDDSTSDSSPFPDVKRCNTTPPLIEANTTITIYGEQKYVCYLQLKVPLGSVIKLRIFYFRIVRIEIGPYERGNHWYPLVTIKKESDLAPCYVNRPFSWPNRWCSEYRKTLYTWTNNLLLKLRTLMPYTSYSVILMQFRFEAINPSDLDRVKFIFLSPSQGYIQTPRCLNAFFQSCATITPPAGQGIFITQNGTADIKHLHWPLFSQGPCGQIYTTDKPPDPVVFWSTTSMSLLYKEIPKSWGGKEWEYLHFIQTVYKKQNCMKVNIVFSFQQNKPQKIGSKWNCSRSEWPGLYQQFPCDRQCQCVDGEDETKCFYYSEHCGPDKFTAEGGCYVYFDDVENGLDIRKSKQVCERKGGVLAIFESTKQWSSVISTLKKTTLKPFYTQIDINVGVSAMKTSEDIFKENMYINTWQWGDGSIAYNFHASFHHVCNQDIVKVYENESHSLNMRLCAYNQAVIKVNEHLSKKMSSKVKGVLCKVSLTDNKPHEKIKIETIHDLTASHVPLVTCLLGYVTHVAMACDSDSLCTGKMERRGVSRTAKCKAAQTQFSPYFRCEATDDYVSYSVVCDWRQDCKNNSDESFCQFPPCAQNTFNCGQGQCIDIRQVCDNFVNCWTTRDEKHCPPLSVEMVFNVTNPPALVNFDRPGGFSLIPLPGNTTRCPDSHFHCPGNGYCLPVYTRCNGVTDCPGREDETGCDKLTCEGLYQCRGNDREICLHVDHLCDGWPQCPQQDDEVMCGLTDSCPDQCVCYGPSFTDVSVFQPDTFPKIRYLEGRGSGLTLDVITNQIMLIHLGAGACGWRNMSDMFLPNLHVLDISDNLIQCINSKHFSQLGTLEELDLSGNPLSFGMCSDGIRYKLKSIMLLSLSRVSYNFSKLHAFSVIMPQIQIMDLSHSRLLTSLQGIGLFRNLKSLDLQGCPLADFSFLNEIDDLQQLFTDNFKLCCPALLPDNFVGICHAPEDELSSCDNLLKSNFYLAAIIIFMMSALLGNLCSIIYRIWSFSSKSKVGYAVFVIHLSMSDFFMGVYLLIIGVADRLYAGTYLWNESYWKGSTACRISGFISLLSCEVSSFLICLITLDRFLVMHFPFSRLRFGPASAHVACTVSWGLGVILASIPLLPVMSHWEFYSQTGICIPLPVTRTGFPGRHYSFSIMVVFNMIIFLCIAMGQTLIYWSIRANTLSGHGSNSKENVVIKDKTRSKEATIARRLLVIAMSDFLCWFPIGVCGLLAKLDVPVPGEINTALAVFVLPCNSALNPFLYTYTIVQENRRKKKETKLLKLIAAQVKTELSLWNR